MFAQTDSLSRVYFSCLLISELKDADRTVSRKAKMCPKKKKRKEKKRKGYAHSISKPRSVKGNRTKI